MKPKEMKKRKQKPKARSDGEGCIHQLPRGKWRVVISVGFDGAGRRKRKTRIAKSRADAVAFLKELQQDAAMGIAVETPRITVAEFLDRWMKDVVATNRSANTQVSYGTAVKHLKAAIGRMRLTKVAPQHLQAMFAAMQRDGIGGRTRQNCYIVLRVALAQAVTWQMLPRNPCAAIPRPTHRQRDMQPFTVAEVESVLAAADKHRLSALFHVAFRTGMREGELFGARWSDVDFNAETISVEQQVQEIGTVLQVVALKTRRSRRKLELTPACIQAIEDHRARVLKEGFAGRDLIFVSTNGEPIRRTSFNRIWKRLLKAAEVPYRGFHNVRHTFATDSLRDGVPVHIVSAALGHEKPATTLNVYSHVLACDQKQVRAAAIRRLG